MAAWYGLGFRAQVAGVGVDWVGATTIRCALLEAAHTPDQDAHEFWDDVSADEVSGTGYTAEGEAITGRALLAYDSANNRTALDGDDVVWADSTIDAGYAVIYHDTGTPSTSRLLGYVDFEGEQSSSAADFTIAWAAAGILRGAAANPA